MWSEVRMEHAISYTYVCINLVRLTDLVLLSTLETIVEFVFAPEAFYERSWTGPMQFSVGCSTFYNQLLAFLNTFGRLSIVC